MKLARTKNTNKKYDSYFNRWSKWSTQFSEIQVLPAKSIHVALFLVSLIQQEESLSIIESCVYAIKRFHGISSFEDPCATALCRNILEAAKITCERKKRRKEPFKVCNLKDIY